MLERHAQKGMRLNWLEDVYKGEERTWYAIKVEWSRNIKNISVEARTKKVFFRSKTIVGGDALWLPFTPGAINYAISTGRDVISGPFSGCIMAAYNKGGGRRVCHVSTEASEDHRNDCKALWRNVKDASTACTEFKPFDAIDKFSSKTLRRFGHIVVFGIITGDNKCYSLITDRTSDIITAKAIVKMEPLAQS